MNSFVPSSGIHQEELSQRLAGTRPAATSSSATTGCPERRARQALENDGFGRMIRRRDGRGVLLGVHFEIAGVDRTRPPVPPRWRQRP